MLSALADLAPGASHLREAPRSSTGAVAAAEAAAAAGSVAQSIAESLADTRGGVKEVGVKEVGGGAAAEARPVVEPCGGLPLTKPRPAVEPCGGDDCAGCDLSAPISARVSSWGEWGISRWRCTSVRNGKATSKWGEF